MLTESQKRYLEKIPEDAVATVAPFDPSAAHLAQDIMSQIHALLPELEFFWSGALALGISGTNDIDLSILGKREKFEQYLPALVSILGEPQVKGEDKVLWRTTKDGYKVDAYLGDKDSEDIQFDRNIFEMLRADPKLLEEYRLLKEAANGLPFREYQKRKYEFYNRILGLGN